VIYVARQLGHDARVTLGTYGHVIDELDAPHIDAEQAIADARVAVNARQSAPSRTSEARRTGRAAGVHQGCTMLLRAMAAGLTSKGTST
jgi:hypothetical protein